MSNLLPCCLLVATLLSAACRSQCEIRREVAVMGTWLTVRVEAAGRDLALAASEAAVRAVESVEARLSTWRPDSEVSRANVGALGRSTRLGADTCADLAFAFDLMGRSGHAFDPTIGALLEAYGLRGERRWPTAAERAAALAACGRSSLSLHPGALVRHAAAASLSTDAFAKGVALDRAGEAAMAAGARAVDFDFGGQWAVRGGELRVAIAHPWHRETMVAGLRLRPGASAATSGNGERTVEVAGRRTGHLLDPRSGLPAADFGSVTAVASSAALADAASTALFVLGIERGLATAKDLGVEVLFVEVLPPGTAGSAPATPPLVRLHATPGLRDDLHTVAIPLRDAAAASRIP